MLPSYGGYQNIWLLACRQKQAQFKACVCEVPQLKSPTDLLRAGTSDPAEGVVQPAAPTDAASGTSSTSSNAVWAHTLAFALELGCDPTQPISHILASMPRSKAEKQATKQAKAVVTGIVEPCMADLEQYSRRDSNSNISGPVCTAATHTTGAVSEASQSKSAAGLGSVGQQSIQPCNAVRPALAAPSLADITKLHVAAFCGCSSGSVTSSSTTSQHWCGSALELEEPLLAGDVEGALLFAGGAADEGVCGPVDEPDSCSTRATKHYVKPLLPSCLCQVSCMQDCVSVRLRHPIVVLPV